MATLSDIGVAAAINILTAFAFFVAFAILRLQPVNDRVYFPKWYIRGLRASPLGGAFVSKIVNLDYRSYLRFLNWMPAALQMPEPELIEHAGLVSAVYLRIYLTGLKIFVPIALLAFSVMVPVNWMNTTLKKSNLVYSNLDELSISNLPLGSHRRLIVFVAFFFLTFFFMIPIALVQSLANIEGIERAVPFLKPIVEVKFIKSFIQGFLPGIALKLFLIFLPSILMIMSKFEGFTSISALERRAATRYYIFQFINVFLGSIITGTAFQQLDKFIHQSANEIPITIGVSIPMKATFFITYIMVDGWAGVAGEILRLKPLIIYHLKNTFLVKTEKDREEAMDPGTLGFNTGEPQIQLYFLLGLVYAVVSPILVPFIIVFFGLAYIVYRHQIINVYNQEYESAAAFWPDVHGRIITALIVSQLLLMGLISTKEAAQSTPLLLTLVVLTIWFHLFCKGRYEPAFKRNPLQEAMRKDTLERAREPNLNLKGFLQSAYIHPVFKGADDSDSDEAPEDLEQEPVVVPTKRMSRRNTPVPSKYTGSISSSQAEDVLMIQP